MSKRRGRLFVLSWESPTDYGTSYAKKLSMSSHSHSVHGDIFYGVFGVREMNCPLKCVTDRSRANSEPALASTRIDIKLIKLRPRSQSKGRAFLNGNNNEKQ